MTLCPGSRTYSELDRHEAQTSVGPVRLDGLCVCVVKPYFYNFQQFKQLARGLRTRQPVTLVPDQQVLLARLVTTTNRTVVSD